MADLCIRCSKKAKFLCSKCNAIWYCGRDCQLEHWRRGHKGQCNVLAQKISAEDRIVVAQKSQLIQSQVPDVPLEKWLCPRDRVKQVSSYVPSKEVFSFSGVGIENMGNTCFANSVLQCLTYSVPFCMYLQSKEHRSSNGGCVLQKKDEFCTLCSMEDWSNLLVKTSSDYIVRPVAILRNLKALKEDFVFGMQEDANEFLYALVEGMQKSLIANSGRTVSAIEEDTTFLHQVFGGFKCLQIKCLKCKNVTELKSFEYFLTLPLVLNQKLSLEELLINFFQSHIVEGRKCDTENCDGENVMDSFLYRAHPLIILQLMRFDFAGNKINDPVAFREEISLNQFKHPTLSETDDLDYELYGVIVHYGNILRAGHFVCFVKEGGQWYLCDDQKITPVTPSIVLKQMAYMLFYRKKQKSASDLKKSKDKTVLTKSGSGIATKSISKSSEGLSKSSEGLSKSSEDTKAKELKTAKKLQLNYKVYYRLDSQEESFEDFVVKIECEGQVGSVRAFLKKSGSMKVECGDGLVEFTIPFGLGIEGAKCRYYSDQNVVVCVVPFALSEEEKEGEFMEIPLLIVKGDIVEQVDETCALDIGPSTTTSSSSSSQKSSSLLPQQVEYDWNKEASYLNLYEEIKKQNVVEKKSGGNTGMKVNDKMAPKRNDKCPCGSGKKYKNCHGK